MKTPPSAKIRAETGTHSGHPRPGGCPGRAHYTAAGKRPPKALAGFSLFRTPEKAPYQPARTCPHPDASICRMHAAPCAIVAFVKNKASAFELLTLARKALAKALESEPRDIGLLTPGMQPAQQEPTAEAVVAAMAAAIFKPPVFKTSADDNPLPASLTLLGLAKKMDFAAPWRQRKATRWPAG